MTPYDFGEILRQWDQEHRKRPNHHNVTRKALESFLEQHPPPADVDKEETAGDSGNRPEVDAHGGPPHPAPKRLPIEDTLDLHGLTRPEAERRTDSFIREAARRGFRKVLVIYGKGLHSPQGAVLRRAIHRLLQDHPLTGAMGTPERRDGGTGAVWVMVRQRSR
ncbi:MAG: Smr/MutS family protein [Spirochaetota bacterium]